MQHMIREANKYVDALAVLRITLNDNFRLYWICPTSMYFVYLWKVQQISTLDYCNMFILRC